MKFATFVILLIFFWVRVPANPMKVIHNGPKVLIKSAALSQRQRNELHEVYLTPYRYIEKEARAIALISGRSGVSGVVVFTQQKPPAGVVLIRGNITGLTRGSHGFHIHQAGDLRNDCLSTGAHYNPHNFSHAAPDSRHRHTGDLGNILADFNGVARINSVDKQITLIGSRSIIGRSLVIHELEDDLGLARNEASLQNGNSGQPIACGIIGIMN